MRKTINIFLILFFYNITLYSLSPKHEKFIKGDFLFSSDPFIIYSENTDEDGEYIPMNLISLNTGNLKCDTILRDCIYWDCFKRSDSGLLVSDGIAIFKYDIHTKQKDIIYSVPDDQTRICNLVEMNNTVYFIATDFNKNTFHFYSLKSGDINKIHTTTFSEYEYPETSLKSIDKRIICLFQFELCVFDTSTGNINSIGSSVHDFALTDASVVYLTHINKKTSKSDNNYLYEYMLDNDIDFEIKDYPFSVSHHNLYTRCLDGVNEVYFHKEGDIYLYSSAYSSYWKKENESDFAIFKNDKITVYLNTDGFCISTLP